MYQREYVRSEILAHFDDDIVLRRSGWRRLFRRKTNWDQSVIVSIDSDRPDRKWIGIKHNYLLHLFWIDKIEGTVYEYKIMDDESDKMTICSDVDQILKSVSEIEETLIRYGFVKG